MIKSRVELPCDYNKLSPYGRKLVRHRYIKIQNNLCYYCGKNIYKRPKQYKKLNMKLFPENFLSHPIHLHHNYKTGLTIGAVHAYCNGVLWQYEGE